MAPLRTIRPRLQAVEPRRVAPPPKVADSFYTSPEWRALRASIVKQRGWRCQKCGRTHGQIYADHIEELKDGGAPLDPANVQLLCHPCHQSKSAAEKKRREAAR